MRYFFVDTENVQQYNFIDELNVSEKDALVLVVSKNSQRIKIDDLKLITDSKAKIIYKEVDQCSKNAMDFCLITELTLMIVEEKSGCNQYLIISNDNDFVAPVKHLRKLTAADIKMLKPKGNKISNKDIMFTVDNKLFDVMFESSNLSQIHNKLTMVYGEKGKEIYANYKNAFNIMFKSSNLRDFHNALISEYGREGTMIYKKCKNKFIIKKRLGDFS